MREKIQRFMIGRYGADELAKAQSIAALILLFLSMFSRLGIFYWLAIALMIYSTWRMFSKNISKRYAENQKYLNYRYQMTVKWDRFKKHLAFCAAICFKFLAESAVICLIYFFIFFR